MINPLYIMLLVAGILFIAALVDSRREDGGNALRRKIWIRVGIMFIVICALTWLGLQGVL